MPKQDRLSIHWIYATNMMWHWSNLITSVTFTANVGRKIYDNFAAQSALSFPTGPVPPSPIASTSPSPMGTSDLLAQLPRPPASLPPAGFEPYNLPEYFEPSPAFEPTLSPAYLTPLDLSSSPILTNYLSPSPSPTYNETTPSQQDYFTYLRSNQGLSFLAFIGCGMTLYALRGVYLHIKNRASYLEELTGHNELQKQTLRKNTRLGWDLKGSLTAVGTGGLIWYGAQANSSIYRNLIHSSATGATLGLWVSLLTRHMCQTVLGVYFPLEHEFWSNKISSPHIDSFPHHNSMISAMILKSLGMMISSALFTVSENRNTFTQVINSICIVTGGLTLLQTLACIMRLTIPRRSQPDLEDNRPTQLPI